jgi:hypothetical protein
MKNRNGEKIGWTFGWMGGFLWAAILAVVFLFQQKWDKGIAGLVLVSLAVFFILIFAPWKRPDTRCWKLMVPLYTVLILSAVWVVWAFGGLRGAGMNWWNMLWLLPTLIPFYTIGRRTWNDTSPGREKE